MNFFSNQIPKHTTRLKYDDKSNFRFARSTERNKKAAAANTMTDLVSPCHPSDLNHHHGHRDLVVQAHPSVQGGRLLAHLSALDDQVDLVHLVDHPGLAFHDCPVKQMVNSLNQAMKLQDQNHL